MGIALKPIESQVIVITGASSGIGLATAVEAARRGARVVLVARSARTLASTAQRIVETGGEAMHVVADVADRAQLQGAADAAVARFGGVDTWVNNAGVSVYGRIEEVDERDHRRVFDTNFWGVVHGSLIALPLLRARGGGALVNVGSEVSEGVIALQGMYSASKHAVKGFTDALRVEVEKLAEEPISISLIQPTAVNTPFAQNARNYMDREPKLPTPQIDPKSVADAILDAASHHRRDVKVGTGAILNTFVAKFAPSLADSISAKQAERQQYDEPPRNPLGALHRPSESGRMTAEGPTQRSA